MRRHQKFRDTQCMKLQYASKQEAMIASRKVAGRGNSMNPYLCQLCGAWHIGHATGHDLKKFYQR